VPEQPVGEAPHPAPATASPATPSVREGPRLAPDSRPWATEPKPAPVHRETREAPALQPRPAAAVAPAASRADAPAVAARSALPPPPSIPPLLSTVPRLSPVEPVAAPTSAAPTPLSVVPEPSPTRREKVVAPPPPVEALSPAHVVPARGAGSWSPAELLAQVIAEVQVEERRAGLPHGTTWEPVPLDATQPISTDEVAVRLAAETGGPDTLSVAAAGDDEDLPALRHEAGRAGMRMALLAAGGLIVGMLVGWSATKVLTKPPRPQAERITEANSAQAPTPKN
jgi:hypothetical protein